MLLLSACSSNGNGRGGLYIEPTPGAVGAVTLSWQAPTEYEDGTSLVTDLAGFTIYYGIASGLYTEEIVIGNPSISTYIVESLPPGEQYYFAMTAHDMAGVESLFSNEVSKIVE